MKKQISLFFVLTAPVLSFALSPCLSEIKKICPSSGSQIECLKTNFSQFSPKCAKAVEGMIGPQAEAKGAKETKEVKETKAEGAPSSPETHVASPAEKPTEKVAEKPVEKPAEKETVKEFEKPAEKPTAKPADTKSTTTDQSSVAVTGSNQLAFDLYKALLKTPENLFFSPISIETALSMTSAGARKMTLDQMLAVLHLPNQAHAEFRKIMQVLNGSHDFQLLMANRLWGQSGNTYDPEFMKILAGAYGAELSPLDFKTKPEPSREQINQWVQKQTMDKIKNLLPPGSITTETDLVLTNAIYFKGSWSEAFKKENTRNADFLISGEKKINIPFMNLLHRFPYAENAEVQYLRMPYQGSALVMEILLPAEGGSLAMIDSKLSPAYLTALANQAQVTQVNVSLPKFKVQQTLELNGMLGAMGMPLAFDKNKADFSGMRKLKPGENIYISRVIHKAFVDVNEEGTEAAAATAVVMDIAEAAPPAPRIFRANHQFLFFIRHLQTGAILFMGRFSNP